MAVGIVSVKLFIQLGGDGGGRCTLNSFLKNF